jgi:hypothetical protein
VRTKEEDKELDYLFDLQGYLVLKGAISKDDLAEMNGWVDDHWEIVENPPLLGNAQLDVNPGEEYWIGNVEVHSYGPDDGVNFQNIVEGGAVFERLIDHPAWHPLAERYVNPVNGLSIHENLLNVRGPGGFLYIHCGGHTPLFYLTFRQHNTGEWMVGQINVLMALEDIGPGDGPTVLVPGSHKATEIHPRLELDGKGIVAAHHEREAAGTALAMKEIYLEAGDVVFFTDAITHGSAERTNPGYRRSVIFRYSPRYLRTRFNYQLSSELSARLTPRRREILEPVAPRGSMLTPAGSG